MELGERIKAARGEFGLTQEQAAEALGVSRQTLSNWERGKTYPDIVSVIKMSDLYCVSLDRLLKEEKKEKASMDKTYMEFLKESTDAVRSENRRAKMVLIFVTVGIWALSMLAVGAVWAAAGADAAGYCLTAAWMILPVLFFTVSAVVGRYDCFGRMKWIFAAGISIMYTLSGCITAIAAENTEGVRLLWPSFAKLPVGLVISLTGFALGMIIRRRQTQN